MRVRTLILCMTLLVACAKAEEQPPADTSTVGMEPAPAPTMSLASVAGTWNVLARPTSGSDTSTTTYVLTATADSTGWTITFPNRSPIPMRVVSVDGDSIVADAGPFQSARRKGIQVSTRTVLRMDGDRLTGSTQARYETGPDRDLTLTVDGTRAP